MKTILVMIQISDRLTWQSTNEMLTKELVNQSKLSFTVIQSKYTKTLLPPRFDERSYNTIKRRKDVKISIVKGKLAWHLRTSFFIKSLIVSARSKVLRHWTIQYANCTWVESQIKYKVKGRLTTLIEYKIYTRLFPISRKQALQY